MKRAGEESTKKKWILNEKRHFQAEETAAHSPGVSAWEQHRLVARKLNFQMGDQFEEGV